MKSIQCYDIFACYRQEGWMDYKDNQTFKKIYDQYFGLIHFMLKQSGIPEADRDDLVQETFFRLYKSDSQIRQEKVKGFLIVTAKNLVIDRYRRQKTRKTDSIEEQMTENNEPLWRSDPNRELEVSLVGNIIDKISSERGNECFGMFYREGMTMKEISEKTGKPLGTIAAKIARLRGKFKEHIKSQINLVN